MKGYLISNVFAVCAMWLTKLLVIEANTLVFSEFVTLPILMGLICAWYWRHQHLTTKQLIGRALINALIGIALSAIFLGEGTICLVIVSPLIIVFILTGLFLGRSMFKQRNDTLHISLFLLLLLTFFTDVRMHHHFENMVADTMLIKAPASEVWKYVVAYERIETPDKYWLFKIGMPSPVQATASGNYAGAERKCIFSNGYIFDEKITTYDKDKNLTFAITQQPRDPEIMGHIDILKGQFILKDNGDGTTTLTGNSWYQLHVFPVWYYNIWAESITRNVHLRVMEHIKLLSEQH
ncbi:hypothetical protein [Chitinophaga sp. S165]|uniref:hypothetical protein n=1 Tax=Chitinophaga sp. S165 TaxID=2135462 RepID=UPI000D7150D7|nr:hypothetical protein [Chitinophaga sp. S165]PWV46577.1 hypothetical protein C7475_110137 [Chitinophaga sp. S165]